MWENKDGKTPEQWDEEMEAENEVQQEEGLFREGNFEAQAQVEEEDEKADVRSWVEGGRSGRYQPGARRPIPGSVVTGESESEEPLGPVWWARMTWLGGPAAYLL